MSDSNDPLSYPMHQLSIPAGQPLDAAPAQPVQNAPAQPVQYTPPQPALTWGSSAVSASPAPATPASPTSPTYPGATPLAAGSDPAVDMIRSKLQSLYADEPAAEQELAQAQQQTHPGSKHQQYMAQLSASGMSAADIQTAWHGYYASLPEHEKYEVWQEFYVQNGAGEQTVASVQPHIQPDTQQSAVPTTPLPQASAIPAQPTTLAWGSAAEQGQAPRAESIPAALRERSASRTSQSVRGAAGKAAERLAARISPESAAAVRDRLLGSVKTAGQRGDTATRTGKKPRSVWHSLAFGLGCGALAVFIFMFSFFNEFMIAPFIQPSRRINDTPVIVNTAAAPAVGETKILIPKINLEIPVDYTQTTTDEKQIELALDKGVVHYPTTAKPGQLGNAAFFGHSSNNIFNPGKYKFAFVLLHNLSEGDVFYLSYEGKLYAYKVFSKRIVPPSEVSVLAGVSGHSATATLITCDPPGTSINRLVVVGDQISPSPAGNYTPSGNKPVETAVSSDLPGNGPTLWGRIWGSIF